MADYFESGFCVRERSWHGKELLLDEAPETWDDGRLAAGLMWEPRLVPLYYRNAEGEFVEADDARRVERRTDGAGHGHRAGGIAVHAQRDGVDPHERAVDGFDDAVACEPHGTGGHNRGIVHQRTRCAARDQRAVRQIAAVEEGLLPEREPDGTRRGGDFARDRADGPAFLDHHQAVGLLHALDHRLDVERADGA